MKPRLFIAFLIFLSCRSARRLVVGATPAVGLFARNRSREAPSEADAVAGSRAETGALSSLVRHELPPGS